MILLELAANCDIFSSTHHTKQLNLLPTLPASCVVIYSWLFACPADMELFKDHLGTCGCLNKCHKNKPQQK